MNAKKELNTKKEIYKTATTMLFCNTIKCVFVD